MNLSHWKRGSITWWSWKRIEINHIIPSNIENKLLRNGLEKKSSRVKFEVEDIILKWDEERSNLRKHKKFDSLWSGAYIIIQALQNNTFKLQDIFGSWELPILENKIYLKYYWVIKCFHNTH